MASENGHAHVRSGPLSKPDYRLNFDQHARKGKLLDAYKRARWTSVAEKFLPNRIYLCPVSNIDQIDGHFQYIAEICARSVQNGLEIYKNLARLGDHIAVAHQLSRTVQSGQPRNKEQITEPNSVRIMANRFTQACDP
jgi:hypothetical protein